MPIYDFECDDCNALEEVLIPISKSDEPLPCGTCGGEMHRKVSAPRGVKVNGEGSHDGHEKYS